MYSRIDLESIARGIFCNIKEKKEYIVNNKDEWYNLFNKFRDGKSPSDYELDYDFSKISIVAVFFGDAPFGSALKINEAKDLQGKIEIVVHTNIQQGENKWDPYHIVKMPKTTKLITFQYQHNPNLKVSDFGHC